MRLPGWSIPSDAKWAVFFSSNFVIWLRNRRQVSLNDSDDTGSLIDEDDESTDDDQASRSYSDSNDDNF